ncbi:MAG: hypothetical protein FWB96_00055 [Defluviitaleaceae bacterium]|nr:hypothetical protein [Defluviitaleaceae bacterium]MCL2262564.1 hypothetical protein [Defluviitaleaceae bacterium]
MKLDNGLKIAVVYGSVFLGAGFASGRELIQYFVGFGRIGMWGLIVSGVLFALVGWAVLSICRREEISSYGGLMRHLLGDRLGPIMEGLVAGFLFCLFTAMLAGAGATAYQAFYLPFSAGALLVGLIVFAILCFGLDGIVKVNLFLAPLMLLGGIFIGIYSFLAYTAPVFASFGGRFGLAWLLSAVVYGSYNLVTGVPVLAATSKLAETKRDTLIGGLLGGGVITILGLAMSLPLFLYYADIISLEIPFLHIASGYGNLFSILYLTVLISALLTTAACNAFAVLQWLEGRGYKNKVKAAAVLCILGVLAAHIGFSNIVIFVYPIFGFLGLFKIIVILLNGWKKK